MINQQKSQRLTESAVTKDSSSMASIDIKDNCCVCFKLFKEDDEVNEPSKLRVLLNIQKL